MCARRRVMIRVISALTDVRTGVATSHAPVRISVTYVSLQKYHHVSFHVRRSRHASKRERSARAYSRILAAGYFSRSNTTPLTSANGMSLLHFFSLLYTSLACTLALLHPNAFRHETARNRESNEYRLRLSRCYKLNSIYLRSMLQ